MSNRSATSTEEQKHAKNEQASQGTILPTNVIIHNEPFKKKENVALYTKNSPFLAKIVEKECLSRCGSTKSTYHIALEIGNADFPYAPGDSIGILPQNEPQDVAKLLKSVTPGTVTDPKRGDEISIEQFLTERANLDRITSPLIRLTGEDPANRLIIAEKHDVVSYLAHHKDIEPQALANVLAPLLPRFYSIASSQKVSPGKIDLLVATFAYEKGGRIKTGVGSDFLCHRATLNTTPIPIYPHPAASFSLASPDTPIIMIGPGTGIAPFRAFLQERAEFPTENWLFFGERNRTTDYYYQDFLEDLEKNGKLRLDLAFSRDQDHKIYVQDLIRKNGEEFWEWIDKKNATIYLCGDAKQMAKAVNATFHEIAEEYGNLSKEEAANYIKQLRKNKRCLMDVY